MVYNNNCLEYCSIVMNIMILAYVHVRIFTLAYIIYINCLCKVVPLEKLKPLFYSFQGSFKDKYTVSLLDCSSFTVFLLYCYMQ